MTDETPRPIETAPGDGVTVRICVNGQWVDASQAYVRGYYIVHPVSRDSEIVKATHWLPARPG